MNIKYLPTSSNRLKPLTRTDSIKVDTIEDINRKPNVKNKDNVNVSNDHQLLENVKQELAKVPDVDEQKVSFIRNALKNGTFELDFDKISEAILAQHSK